MEDFIGIESFLNVLFDESSNFHTLFTEYNGGKCSGEENKYAIIIIWRVSHFHEQLIFKLSITNVTMHDHLPLNTIRTIPLYLYYQLNEE